MAFKRFIAPQSERLRSAQKRRSILLAIEKLLSVLFLIKISMWENTTVNEVSSFMTNEMALIKKDPGVSFEERNPLFVSYVGNVFPT